MRNFETWFNFVFLKWKHSPWLHITYTRFLSSGIWNLLSVKLFCYPVERNKLNQTYLYQDRNPACSGLVLRPDHLVVPSYPFWPWATGKPMRFDSATMISACPSSTEHSLTFVKWITCFHSLIFRDMIRVDPVQTVCLIPLFFASSWQPMTKRWQSYCTVMHNVSPMCSIRVHVCVCVCARFRVCEEQ